MKLSFINTANFISSYLIVVHVLLHNHTYKKMHTPINSLITFILFPLLASVFIVIVIVLFKKYKFLSQVKVVISYYL